MPYSRTVTIEPNDKYHKVIWSQFPDDEPVSEPEDQGPLDLIAHEREDIDREDLITLSWDTASVPSDPDRAAKIATYFDGVDPHEPTELIRAKLRLLDVEIYANASLAATNEML